MFNSSKSIIITILTILIVILGIKLFYLSSTKNSEYIMVKKLSNEVHNLSIEKKQLTEVLGDILTISELVQNDHLEEANLKVNSLRMNYSNPFINELEGTIHHFEQVISLSSVINDGSIKGYLDFQNENRVGVFDRFANDALSQMELSYFLYFKLENSIDGLSDFKSIFPNSQYSTLVDEQIAEIKYQRVQDSLDLIQLKNQTQNNYSIRNTNSSNDFNHINPYNQYNSGYVNPNANPQRVKVNGYTKKNGTYVKPHIRTAPNSTKTDNLRYK